MDLQKEGGGLLNINSQDFIFWRLVYELVITHRYRILKLNDNGEVWLELMERRDKKMIRLLRYDIDWGNWLVRDIEKVSKVIKQYKKQSYRKKVDAYNVYVSTYPPVDDWDHEVDDSNKIESTLIELANCEEEIEKLFKSLSLPSPNIKSWYSDMVDPHLLINSIRHTEKTRMQEEKDLLFAKKPFLTYILVAINVIMFFLLEWTGSSTDLTTLIKFGAKYNTAILEGDWWRFVTPMFLHIGFLHLLMNTLALYYLGISVERIYGTWRFLIIYFAAGIVGGVASFAFTTQVSAGASGAIFGCFGALLYFGVAHPSLFFRTMGGNVFAVLAINLAFGFLVPMVDNSAHIGGLLGGFLASAFVHLPNHKKLLRQLAALLLFSAIIGAGLAYGFYFSDQKEDPLVVVGQLSQQLIEAGEYEKANHVLSEVVQTNNEVPPEILFLLSYTEIKLGQTEKAISLLETVVEEKNEFHEAYYNLALLYLDLGDYEKAEVSIQKALKIKPHEGDYRTLLTEIEKIK